MSSEISKERLEKYFQITSEALAAAQKARVTGKISLDGKEKTLEVLDMVERYVSDAKFFASRGDVVLAFAALNYAHGWLDAGARLGLFSVKDSRLFTVDDE